MYQYKDELMKPMTNIRLGIALALSTVLLSLAAGAQSSSQAPEQSSLGAYARKVHKDSDTAKPKPKVFDNDNLPKDDKLSIVGQPPATSTADATATDASKAAASAATADAKTAAPAKPADDEQAKKQAVWKSWQEKLSGQKEQIDLVSRELDVTQREYQLRAAAIYADTGNRLRNQAQWDKQDAEYKQKIADKEKALEDAKQKLTDMQEDARKAGVPASMID